MIISEKQIQLLILILRDSLSINHPQTFSIDYKQRNELLSKIMTQQSEELKTIE